MSAPARGARSLLRGWRYLYGAHPLHLLAMIGCFALSAYVVSFVYEDPGAEALAIWFAGAVLGHDLVLYPLYALADQPLTILRWARRRALPRTPPLVPAINHVRVPVLGSAVLGLIYFPTITDRGQDALRFTAGIGTESIYGHWLLITGVLFLGSAVIYGVRLGVAAERLVRRPRRRAAPDPVVVGDPSDATGDAERSAAPVGADAAATGGAGPDDAGVPTHRPDDTAPDDDGAAPHRPEDAPGT